MMDLLKYFSMIFKACLFCHLKEHKFLQNLSFFPTITKKKKKLTRFVRFKVEKVIPFPNGMLIWVMLLEALMDPLTLINGGRGGGLW